MCKIFDHEKLRVYQASIGFVVWVQKIMDKIPKRHAVHDRLDRASTSIPLNIAEGNGKYTQKDRCRFFDIARGSALECAAALDVLVVKTILSDGDVQLGKDILHKIVSMLVGLIKSNSTSRVCEPAAQYG
ncbi:MAG: four helix bundle protein [Candidatus Anammoxibacter sp.]